MSTNNRRNYVRAVAIVSLLLGSALVLSDRAKAESQDYRFEIANPPAKSDKGIVVKLRLIHVPDGKPVPGALIIQTKFDMGPEGMGEMTAPAKVTPGREPGIYQVEAQPSMGGSWALTLGAKVQGEPKTVHGTVTIAVPK